MHVMEWLMLATGVSGAFTLVWLWGNLRSWFVRPPVLQVHAGVGLLDQVLREIAAARREVLLCTDMLENPGVAEALLAARARKVNVEVLHGAVAEVYSGSTLGLLLQQQLVPSIDDHASRLACHCLLVDGRTLLLASGPFHPEEEQSAGGVYLLRIQHIPEVIGAFREILSGLRTRSRPARPLAGSLMPAVAPRPTPAMQAAPQPPETFAPPEPMPPEPMPPEPTLPPSWSYPHPETAELAAMLPEPTAPSVPPAFTEPAGEAMPASFATLPDPDPEPEPETAPEPEPEPVGALPATKSLLSRPLATFEAPTSDAEELRQRLPRAVRRPPVLEDDGDEAVPPVSTPATPRATTAPPTASNAAPAVAPPVTQAAAELFARLRREVQARGNKPIAPREGAPMSPPPE
jgi:hypothetical protein